MGQLSMNGVAVHFSRWSSSREPDGRPPPYSSRNSFSEDLVPKSFAGEKESYRRSYEEDLPEIGKVFCLVHPQRKIETGSIFLFHRGVFARFQNFFAALTATADLLLTWTSHN